MGKYLISFRMSSPGFFCMNTAESSAVCEAPTKEAAVQACLNEAKAREVIVRILSVETL